MKSVAQAFAGQIAHDVLPQVSVLLVDDRPENLLALEASLEPLGQRLVRATSGDDALRAVLDEQFAVILMDIRMPGLDGFETIALLKQRPRSRDIPIIFLSAFSEQHHILRSYSSGAVDYLSKPLDPEALRSKVSVFVRLRQNELALQAAHDQLERRVAERTAELAAVNGALQREVADRKAAEHRLFDLAHHDHLTGLPNRALLMEHLNRAIARARRDVASGFAVMMLDVDRFKIVNDSLGHLAGDRLLLEVARRLAGCIREVDTAARLGGDEFAILFDGVTDLAAAGHAAERVQQVFERPFQIEGREVFATASIGIALMGQRYSVGEELLRDADAAMYRAKEAGRARAQVFDVEMHTLATARLRLEADLCRAVDRQELVLCYQPVIALETQKVVGFEALVRWQHPEHGRMAPADFIPLAEDTGIITSIGNWVLAEATRQLAIWSRHAPLVMSVNISSHQFARREFADEVTRVLATSGVPASNLMLEITESVLMPRVGHAAETLSRLAELGVLIGLDDFGTGYSCLSYLHELPVTTLKIDRSFVERIGTHYEVVRAIVSLAHNLDLDVTAEGIETSAQLELLRQLGCEYAQGYYFARPLEADAAAEFLRTNLG